MTATARPLRAGHWSDVAANQPKYPQPSDPQIKTKADMFIALAAWAVGPIVVIGAVALVVLYFKH